MLISAIHAAAVKFPDAAASVVPTLMDFLGDAHQSSAVDVVLFVREMVETYTHLRESVMQKLLSSFGSIQSSRVARVALWLVGEYCTGADDVAQAFTTLKACLGEPPFVPAEAADDDATSSTPSRAEGRPLVLADGSYATQSAVVDGVAAGGTNAAAAVPKLRGMLLGAVPPDRAPRRPRLSSHCSHPAAGRWRLLSGDRDCDDSHQACSSIAPACACGNRAPRRRRRAVAADWHASAWCGGRGRGARHRR